MNPDTVRVFAKNLTSGLQIIIGGQVVTITSVEESDPLSSPPGFPESGDFVCVSWGSEPDQSLIAGAFQPYDVLVASEE